MNNLIDFDSIKLIKIKNSSKVFGGYFQGV